LSFIESQHTGQNFPRKIHSVPVRKEATT
jgi:hypothetical protein